MQRSCSAILIVGVLWALSAAALERPDTTFKIFQFPADQIPRVDGDVSDWGMVPADYAIGIDQLQDTVHHSPIDTTDLDVTVRVGWVKGLNRLYFLYEAYDDYWDFSHRDLHNDILEIVVDGDLSGGPLIPQLREDKDTNGLEGLDDHFKFHGVHAQTYHVLTPADGKPWTMVCMERRLVAFKDLSYGDIRSWRWDFGDGNTSTEQHPIHQYAEPGTTYTVTLYVAGPEGKARMSKVWDVIVR